MPIIQRNTIKERNRQIEKELKRMMSFLSFKTIDDFRRSYGYLQDFMSGLKFSNKIEVGSVSHSATDVDVRWLIKGKVYKKRLLII